MKLSEKIKDYELEIEDVMILSTLNGLCEHMFEIVSNMNQTDKDKLNNILDSFQEEVKALHKVNLEKEVEE